VAAQRYSALKKRKVPTVIVVHHGETFLDDGVNKFTSSLEEGLDNTGLEQALDAARAIAAMGPIVAIYSSDLRRARETAEIIAEECDAPLTTAGLLRPWELGEITGMDEEDGRPILYQHATETPDEQLEGGESYNEWVDRFFEGLDFYVLEPTIKSGGPCVLVEHSLNIQLIKAWIAGNNEEIDPELALESNDVEPGEWFKMVYDGMKWRVA